MVTGDKGLRLIKHFEGFNPRLYNDPADPPNATIGYGHLVHYGPIDGSEAGEFKAGITLAHGLELLADDLHLAEEAVDKFCTVSLNPDQHDALVSFAFNAGRHALAISTALTRINAGDMKGGAEALNMWVNAGSTQKVPGLVARRKAEQNLFLFGTLPEGV